MEISLINPHIRYASVVHYKSEGNPVKCTDCRLYYVLQGQAQFCIDDQAYELIPDRLLYICGGSEYNIIAHETVTMLSLNFDLTQEHSDSTVPFAPKPLQKVTKGMRVILTPIDNSDILNSHTMIDDGTRYKRKFEKILSEFAEGKLFYREMCSAMLKEILLSIHRTEFHKASTIDEVITYIHDNFKRNITNSELATMAGYHEYHLNRLFSKYTGTSMHNYILNIRINEAKRLILNPDISLTDIAEQIGFNNYTYFSSYFKKAVGISPAQYRKKMKNKI